MLRNKVELLAPVGTYDALLAAVYNRADAVYLGAASFGARASASFDEQALKQAIDFAHLFDVKVYVTLNTLVKNSEVYMFLELVKTLVKLKADAVIVQDLGMLRIIKCKFSELIVHASTQMAIHNINGVKVARNIGLDRIVMARESSLSTLNEASLQKVEIEAFIHGAQCVSLSGQCLMSSLNGGRSGNRGKCAQSCRLDYIYKGKQAAWLSPKDISVYDNINRLLKSGVSSFKIEGRLKSPEYVATVCSAYRHRIDSFLFGDSNILDEKPELLQIFNRGGFTQGYMFDSEDSEIIDSQHVSHFGVKIAEVVSVKKSKSVYLADIKLEKILNDQDYLEIRGKTQNQSMIYSGKESKDFATLRLHTTANIGDEVYRLTDASLMCKARKSYQSKDVRKINVAADLYMKTGRPARLKISDKTCEIAVEGEIVEKAKSWPLSPERLEESIRKTGDSIIHISNFRYEGDREVFLPVSEINNIRRKGLDKFLEQKNFNYKSLKAENYYNPITSSNIQSANYDLFVETSNKDLIEDANSDVLIKTKFCYFPNDFRTANLISEFKTLNENYALVLPVQIDDASLERIYEFISENPRDIVINNISHLNFAWPKAVFAGSGFNMFNDQVLCFLKEHGVSAAYASRELSLEDAKLLDSSILPIISPVYGRATMMVLNHCPERVLRGLKSNKEKCTFCDNSIGTKGEFLKDWKQKYYPLFPIHFDNTCINYLLESTPINTCKVLIEEHKLGLRFTNETLSLQRQILNYYYHLTKGIKTENPVLENYGRLYKGVE